MSIFSSSTSWGCPGTDQSPINLSQSSSKPCDLLCELVMDDVMIPQANVIVSDEGLILQNTAGLGSCKYNGEGYTCTMILVNHPSHHTVENIQADAEVIAVFTNPTGKYLCVSSLVRVNPSQTSATQFFSAFVNYADPTQKFTTVNLGENWGLSMMVPPAGSYFVYDGSMVVPPCQSVKWVVFKSMINIDPNDFAVLTRKVAPGSRPIQGLGDREVFYNDIDQLPGGPMPHDNKTYMRCKRVAKKGESAVGATKPVTQVPLKLTASVSEKGVIARVQETVTKQVKENGFIPFIEAIIFVVGLALAFYYSRSQTNISYGEKPSLWAESTASYIRNLFIKKPVAFTTSQSTA